MTLTCGDSQHTLFRVMRNASVQETLLVGAAIETIARSLPTSWTINRSPRLVGDSGADAIVELTGPSGQVRFAVQAKRSGSMPSSVLMAVLQQKQRQAELSVLFVSDYIGPALRAALEGHDISYADATGWMRIVSDEPLVLLTGRGADRSPRRRASSAVTRLNGVAAGRLVRALSIVDLPIGVRRLAGVADVSPGSVSKLLTTLTSEAIVERDPAGAITTVRGRDLIRRWTVDYSFAKSNPGAGFYLAPRGLDHTLDRLDGQPGVVLTGSAAARRMLPASTVSVVPMRLLALYTANPAGLAKTLGLVTANQATANVMIAAPQDASILPEEGVALAPAALVLADLVTLPGRSTAEADQLMDTLAATDIRWAA
jgi:hypothetical protein